VQRAADDVLAGISLLMHDPRVMPVQGTRTLSAAAAVGTVCGSPRSPSPEPPLPRHRVAALPQSQERNETRGKRNAVENRWGTGRIEAFSDGVFAIAITLLVLDIAVPLHEFDHLWHGIAHEWPAYLGYATSFITIGGLWMAHHSVFRRLDFANDAVMRVNLLLLMAVAFLPFPTKLVAEAIHRSDPTERAAVIFYGGALLVIALLFRALWRVASRDRELLKGGVTDREVEAIRAATTPSIGFYVIVIALAIVVPKVAAFGYLAVGIFAVLRTHGGQPTPATRPARE
jgi:uncharacterized membrane protein